jgi:DNA-binding GntR family transcriptional regulator
MQTRDGSRGEHAYRKLRDAIQRGELAPGSRMTEIELSARLKMSRTPVRDALRRLESEGLLAHQPRHGLVVAKLDRQAVLELYAMREVLEGTAAGLCARHASDAEVQDLMELVALEKKLQGDHAALARHNRRFHEALHRGAHNRYLERSLYAVADTIGLLGPSQMLIPRRAKAAVAEHAQIAHAVAKRDARAAEEAARAHVRAARRQRMNLLFPDGE